MLYACGQCGKALYRSDTEGWCHVGQQRGAMWRCAQCGYAGDLPEGRRGHWEPGHVPGLECPRCDSLLHLDHRASFTGEEHQGQEPESANKQPEKDAARCAAQIADREREREERQGLAAGEQEAEQQVKEPQEQERVERHEVLDSRQRVRLDSEQRQAREHSRGQAGQTGKEQRRRGRSRSLAG
jgi:hypothetical protein